jgi:hypothetical protein
MNARRQVRNIVNGILAIRQFPLFRRAKMKIRTADKTPGIGNEFSVLDWPSPELLMAARRARAHAVRDMTLNVCRRLRSLTLRSLPPLKTNREHPARPDTDSVPKVARETLVRAWLEN